MADKKKPTKERVRSVVNLVRGDKKAIELIGAVLTRALNYVTAVYTMETQMPQVILFAEQGERMHTAARLDRNRSLAHNALIDEMKICNRYLFKTFGREVIPPGGIYSSDPIHLTSNTYRYEIGTWAGEVVNSYFKERHP